MRKYFLAPSPLSQWVSQSVMFSDFGDSYCIYRACELVFSKKQKQSTKLILKYYIQNTKFSIQNTKYTNKNYLLEAHPFIHPNPPNPLIHMNSLSLFCPNHLQGQSGEHNPRHLTNSSKAIVVFSSASSKSRTCESQS